MSDIEIAAPTNTVEDRHYLCMTREEYRHFAETLSKNCFLNKDAQQCSISKAKTKKLKNLRHSIKGSPILMKSMIWKEQLRLIEQEIRRRQKAPGLYL